MTTKEQIDDVLDDITELQTAGLRESDNVDRALDACTEALEAEKRNDTKAANRAVTYARFWALGATNEHQRNNIVSTYGYLPRGLGDSEAYRRVASASHTLRVRDGIKAHLGRVRETISKQRRPGPDRRRAYADLRVAEDLLSGKEPAVPTAMRFVVAAAVERPVATAEAKAPPTERRKLYDFEKRSRRYRICIHEASHCWACTFYGRSRYVVDVFVNDTADENGVQGALRYLPAGLSPRDEQCVAVAGWAAQHTLCESAEGCSADFAHLRKLGVRTGDDSGDLAFFSLRESESLRDLRQYVQADMRQHQRFVQTLADALFLDGRVVASEVESLWESLKGQG